jgi:AraC-like DNA-binding protein
MHFLCTDCAECLFGQPSRDNLPEVSRIIRQTFAGRIRESEALRVVLADLREVAGMDIRFCEASPEGMGPPCGGNSALCGRINRTEAGRTLCRSASLQFLERARESTVEGCCVAGTHFCAVPLRSSAGLLGYLVAAGFYAVRPEPREVNRVRHLLERGGVRLGREEVARGCARGVVVGVVRRQALRRTLEMAAGHLVQELSLELFQKGGDLPPSIKRACQLVRERFREDPAQEEVARAVGLSAGHFSRLFHRRTGLRFKEYVNEVRLQQTRQDLRESDEPITQLAFGAGFRSLSQFNRQFKRHHGMSPREYRREQRQRVAAAQAGTESGEPGRRAPR